MLEGLEVSEVRLKDLNVTHSRRIDAEFFLKDYLQCDIREIPVDILRNLTTKIDVGFVGSMKKYYSTSGITLLQTKNINEFFINDTDVIKITKEFHQDLKKSQIGFEDILIARSGSFGKASIYLEKEIVNSSDIIIIKAQHQKVNPYYLVALLNISFGKNQMLRFASGGLQGHVNLTILEELKVPILPKIFQDKIEDILKTAYRKRIQSQHLYHQAEELLLETIGLKDFKPSQEGKNIKGFKESFLSTGRLDAEYYQPKYEEYLQLIKNYPNGYCKLKDIGRFRNGSLISDDLYVDRSKRAYIRIKELSYNQPITDNDVVFIDDSFIATNETTVKTNDFVFATIGTIGKVNLIPKQYDGSFISNNTSRFRMNETQHYFFYELLFRNCAVQEQLQREFTQTVQPKIGNESLENIIIPIVDNTIQQQIAVLIEESFSLRKESERLLEEAKEMVEKEIDKQL